MKILFVQDSLGPGGAERSNSYLWYFLREQGVKVKIILLKRWPGGLEEEVLAAGFDVQFLKTKGFRQQSREIAEIIRNEHPDLVHSVLFNANIRVRTAKTFTRFIHLESLVNLTYDKSRLNDPKVTWLKLTGLKWIDIITGLLGVDHFHANGLTVKKHYTQNLFISDKKISIINRGRAKNRFLADEANRKNIRDEFSAQGKFLFINVGRQEYQKGQDVLLDAIAMLPGAYTKRMRCIIAGREGNFSEALSSKLEELEIEETVRFIGHRNDVEQLLAASDCFVFPSRFEGLPGSVIEAEAAGLPVICSDIENNLEVAEENTNALVFNVSQPEQLSKHMMRIMDDESLRKQFSDASLEIFIKRFEIEYIHIKMLDLYKMLIAERKK